MRQTTAAATMFHLKTRMALLQLQCQRCSATLRSLSHFFLLLPAFGQLLCPVCHFVHFVLRSAPLHPFAARQFASGHTIPLLHSWATRAGCHALRKPPYNTHRVPLRSTTSFIHFSHIQSTRSLLLLCSPCGHRLRYGATLAHTTLIRLTPYATLCPSTVCPSPPAKAGAFTGHPSRWHSQAIPSYLLHCL